MSILTEDNCLICKSKNIKKHSAQFAQFIADRISEGEIKKCELIHCKNCGFAYFNYRFSEEEVKKLYKNYRDDEYQNLRQESESWYTADINKLIGNNKKEIYSRNKNLTNLLKKTKLFYPDKNMNVLDFGGDSGQFIPEFLNICNRYVYDISDKKVLEGIKTLKTLDECYHQQYDLIICANVLEHVVNPDETLKVLKSLLSKNGLLYIEVPYDSPFYKNFFLNFQYLFNPYFKKKDILKYFFSRFLKSYYTMHEHINYFTEKSVQNLLKNNDFKLLSSDISKIDSEIGYSYVISSLSKI